MTEPRVFTEAEYEEARFDGLMLDQQEVRGITFYECIFAGCSGREALFHGCTFDECTFEACNLSLMKVTNTLYMQTRFRDCQMIGINWTVADWSRIANVAPLNFEGCAISHSIFMGLQLKKIDMVRCKAEDVDFSETDLTEANCAYTDFLSSRFQETNLALANFEEALNYQINVYQNQLKKTRFSLPEAVSLLDSLDIVLK